MAVRVTYIAIAMGGVCGALAALVGSPSSPSPAGEPLPAPMGSMPLRPITELGRAPAPVRAADPVRPSASPSASATQAVSLASSTAASPTASAPTSATDSPPPPATKETLLRAEMHCDQKDAAACILAARGYELGSAGTSDPEKAAKYRKIALTLWISQCDHNSAAACATLADMYRAGRGVPQNEKNADALVTRTRELCHYNDAPVCHELPPPP